MQKRDAGLVQISSAPPRISFLVVFAVSISDFGINNESLNMRPALSCSQLWDSPFFHIITYIYTYVYIYIYRLKANITCEWVYIC
jgi:hypothetical protein